MKPSGIGGQAVLEGVMMKNRDTYAVAVRKPNNDIEVQTKNYKGITEKFKFFQLPFIRGIFNFIDSLVLGLSSLTISASFVEDDVEENKIADDLADKAFKEKGEAVMMGLTILFSLVIAIALFMLLPFFLSSLIDKHLNIVSTTFLAVVEGLIRIGIFVGYIFLISRMKDIQRTFMYHGAEHKCINCIENGMNLTVDNVMKSSKVHKRCGTSFIFLVLFISIILYIFIRVDSFGLKILIRVILIPVIAGISYEIIRWAGRSDSLLVRIVSKPGLLMQALTTKEPEDKMVEVAIKSVEAVFDWRKFLAGADAKDCAIEAQVAENEG